MSVLSAQSIRRLCEQKNMVFPFVERAVQGGMSYGLSSCGYDVRVAQRVDLEPGGFTLASTVERFVIPNHVVGRAANKSTLARQGIDAARCTVLEPGWSGHLTLEIFNNGKQTISLAEGDPILQIIFEWLDEETEQPYEGKYQWQAAGPVGPKHE